MLNRPDTSHVFFLVTIVLWSLLPLVSYAQKNLDTNPDNPQWAEENEEEEAYETTVSGYRVHPTDETTGFAETIEVAEENKSVNTVGEVLSEAVGVQVRRLGGLGSYGSASIRGSTSSQVPVFLDGVQLNTGGYPSVNLGDLSLVTLGEIEVYRGGAPVSLGTSGIGGAISLRTRSFDEPFTETALSVGSWNSYRILALHGNSIGPVQALMLLNAQGSKGDFEYLNNNGTSNNETDDSIERRQNNEHIAYGTLLKLSGPIGRWKWTVLNDLLTKRQGIPGLGNIPTTSASLRTFKEMVALRLERDLSSIFTLAFDAGYTTAHEDYDDSQNEIGLGAQRVLSRADAVSGAVVPSIAWNDRHLSDARVAVRFENYSKQEIMQGLETDPKRRVRTEIGLQHGWKPMDPILISPALRVELISARFGGGTTATGTVEEVSLFEHYWSPSLGLRIEIVPGFFFRANGGRYLRTPDILELFGDRGSVVGNPELRPEVGINTDAGLTYILENTGVVSLLRLDAAWFGTWAKDLIAYVQNSQETVRPENVDAARILGGEGSLRFVLSGFLAVEGNYTYLYGINQSDKPYHNGKRLPGRPAHEAFGKIELRKSHGDWAGAAWVDSDYAGGNYLDQANLKDDELARLFFGMGLRTSHLKSGLTVSLEIKNLLDKITARDNRGRTRAIRDYEGFPLPGRTIFATLHWRI